MQPDPSPPSVGDAALARWRERILTATGFAAERILNSQLDPAAFTDALRILGEGSEVDRAYVFHFHPGAAPGEVLCSQLHEWCRPGVPPQIDNPALQDFCFADVGCRRWFEELSANRSIYGDVRRFPPEEQPLLLAQNIRSLAIMPILAHGTLWGFIGFDHCAHEHTWTGDTVGCLRVAARVFGAAFERRDYKQSNDRLLVEYRQLLDNLREVVFRVGPDGAITFLSPAWQVFSGRAPAACIGRSMAEFLHPDFQAQWRINAGHLIDGSKTLCQSELRFLHADGSTRWALGRAGILADESGAPLGFAGTLVDVTAMKSTEAALIEARAAAESANRAKSEFLSTMSHELRTPLNAVLGLSESLLESGEPFEPVRTRRYLDLIHQGGRQLLDQINDILDLARIESGQGNPSVAPLPVDALCQEAVAAIRSLARARNIALASPAPSGLHALGDLRMLLQALHQLLDNALKFTPPGGAVTLAVEARPGGVAISVSDTGVGIAPGQRDRLFKPFSQLDSSLSRRFGGTGMGLVLVDRIVQLNRGRITLESTPGRGSTFTIELPACAAPDPVDIPPVSGTVPSVVLVDDDPCQHTLVGDWLQRKGYHFYGYESAPHALDALGRAPAPSLLLVDINLPGMNGLELVSRLRCLPGFAHTPIITLTALASPEDATRCIQAGATAHLAKPVTLSALAAQMARLGAPAPRP